MYLLHLLQIDITLSYDVGYSEGNGSASNPYVIYTK